MEDTHESKPEPEAVKEPFSSISPEPTLLTDEEIARVRRRMAGDHGDSDPGGGERAMKEMMRPTLERIYNAEQVGQGSCWNVMTYCREIECTINMLESHLERVKRWQRGGNREHFNSEFALLMQELEAGE